MQFVYMMVLAGFLGTSLFRADAGFGCCSGRPTPPPSEEPTKETRAPKTPITKIAMSSKTTKPSKS